MIVQCLRDGLTVGDKLYKKGQVFKIPEDLEEDYFRGLTVVQRKNRQNRIFNGLILEEASAEQILDGLSKAQVKMSDLTDDERKQVEELIRRQAQKRLEEEKSADDLLDLLD